MVIVSNPCTGMFRRGLIKVNCSSCSGTQIYIFHKNYIPTAKRNPSEPYPFIIMLSALLTDVEGEVARELGPIDDE